MATAEQAPTAKKKQQGRSPAYPSVTIAAALAKAKALYDAEGKYPTPMAQAVKHWGYSDKSSGGRLLRAAMRYYGLITVEGDADNGMVKLTPDALSYLLDSREDQTEKKQLVRKLALNPAVHKKLVAQYPEGIISDGNAKHYLVMTEGFNPTAAEELISQFKATATYAELFKPDIVKGNEDDGTGDPSEGLEEEAPLDPRQGALRGRNPPPQSATGKVKVMDGERVVFTEETNPQVYLKLIASGDVDEILLEALEDFVKRQKKRLKATAVAALIGADPTAQ